VTTTRPVAPDTSLVTAGARSVAVPLWLRLPFTITVVAVLLAVEVATGTLLSGVQTRGWYSDIAYGLPAVEAGRWWTPVTGALSR